MSDQPLFHHMDEKEAKYAPDQAAQTDESLSGAAVVPTTGGAFLPADVGHGAGVETGPVIGAAAMAAESEHDDGLEHEKS